MQDYITSLIRTYVPLGVGAVLAYLASRWGIGLDADASVALSVAAVALITGVYYAIARAIEHRFPRLGRFLVGVGARTPVYPRPVPPTVRSLRERMQPGSVPPRM